MRKELASCPIFGQENEECRSGLSRPVIRFNRTRIASVDLEKERKAAVRKRPDQMNPGGSYFLCFSMGRRFEIGTRLYLGASVLGLLGPLLVVEAGAVGATGSGGGLDGLEGADGVGGGDGAQHG